ncbi:MAG: ComEC/Rec2 family competence protein [Spirochaetota bacterium]|nr:ComEC/Rec2 family competence protein [Spirochaetota bacterium]
MRSASRSATDGAVVRGKIILFCRVYTLALIAITIVRLLAQPSPQQDPKQACWLAQECYGRVTRIAQNNKRTRLHLQLDGALLVDGRHRKLRGEIIAYLRPGWDTHSGTGHPARATEGSKSAGLRNTQTNALPAVDERVAVTGELQELPQGEGRLRPGWDTHSGTGRPARATDAERAERGSKSAGNSFWDYLEDAQVRAVIWEVRSLRVLAPAPEMTRRLASLRTALMDYFNPLGERAKALMGALVFGERGGLTREERQEFADAGIIHMMAVSGMHVGVVCAAIYGLFSLLGVGRRIALPLVCLLLFVYAGLCNWTPSVLRAVFSVYVFAALSYFRARTSAMDILIMVASILLFFSPALIRSAGFLLSFAATAGILLFAAPLSEWMRFLRLPKFAGNSLAVSLAAQIAVAPILAACFGRISILAPLVNCLLVPLILCIQGLGCALPLLARLPGGEYAVLFFQAVVGFLFDSVSWISALPIAAIDVPRYSLAVVLGYYLGILLIAGGLRILGIRRRKNRELALAAQLAGLLARTGAASEARDGAEFSGQPPDTHAHNRERGDSRRGRAA